MWNWVNKLQELHNSGQAVAIVTVTRCSGSTPRKTGAKMLVLADGTFFGSIGGGQLEKQAIEDAVRSIQEGRSRTLHFPLHASVGQCCGGVVELLVEVLNQGPDLYLFGAGHVGQALCRVMKETPFKIHLIDERPEWVQNPAIPAGVNRIQSNWTTFCDHARWNDKMTYVAIMTHEHALDQEILRSLVDRPTRYLGLIGSQTKWQSFQNQLTKDGVSSELLSKVRCPIGLNVGGKSPQEVAISIAAELLQIHYGK